MKNLFDACLDISLETLELLQVQCRRQPLAIALFTALCLNLLLAPTVLAATGSALTRGSAYAIGLLLLIMVGLSVYLFAVIFQPERF
ncbi:K(+)-transporting ATPase subunit F [Oscillatoria sp. CS-180]|uniref:K(+)-transporting ATPase subunit F n=1 Tax=Oscillatoria sp. CS-180 TaxID=3021720 RepID=UPI00232F91DE|nr:K(+)-transporting ATPase subunit F [Oscillatoria sp. CS-180]MDB9525085.1 K(+)-transporting ATPase subunit F [Oscillatoria sp. CS-180]